MSFPAPIARFILKPRTAWPPDYLLPPNWQDWEGGAFGAGLMIWSAPYELRKLQVVFSRDAGVGATTDPAVTTHHFINLTGGNPDATWVDGDFTAVEGAYDTLWTALKPFYTPQIVLDQFRWYKAGPAFTPTPTEGNPAVRIVERNVAGTASITTVGALPPQVAVSITERTALRRRWGRAYYPAPYASAPTQFGRLSSGTCIAWANAFETFYEACVDADIIPVVFSPTTESAYSVEEVQVDDLFDVIRSRRWKGALIRERRVIT